MLNWAVNKAGNREGRDLLVLLEPDVGGIEAETHTGIGRGEEERRSVEIRPEIDFVNVVLSPASFHIFSKLLLEHSSMFSKLCGVRDQAR